MASRSAAALHLLDVFDGARLSWVQHGRYLRDQFCRNRISRGLQFGQSRTADRITRSSVRLYAGWSQLRERYWRRRRHRCAISRTHSPLLRAVGSHYHRNSDSRQRCLGLRLAYVEKDSSRWRLAGHRERPLCESLAEKRKRRVEALDVHEQRPAEPDANSGRISGAY